MSDEPSVNVNAPVIDLSGLTKPLTKLIEVSARGLGILHRPRQIRKQAEAEASKIATIATAISQTQNLPVDIAYKDEHLQISLRDGTRPAFLDAPTTTIEQRAAARLSFQEVQRQESIEGVISVAADELSEEEDVSDQPVDDDWATRFFRAAEDISSEQMRDLWGRILAGEIRQPRSFSLRTLDVVRNLSTEDAVLFSKVAASRILRVHGNLFLLRPEKDNDLKDGFDFTYGEILHLSHCGLMNDSAFIATNIELNDEEVAVFRMDKLALVVVAKGTNVRRSLNIHPFTLAGAELATLAPWASNESLLRRIAKLLKGKNITIAFVDLIEQDDGNLEIVNERPIEDSSSMDSATNETS